MKMDREMKRQIDQIMPLDERTDTDKDTLYQITKPTLKPMIW